MAAPAFDVQAVCTGFIYALGIADKFIRTGSARCALVVGAETLSRIVDWTDRSTCVLFGDGAGAVVLEASEEPGILSTHLHADGRYETSADRACRHFPGLRPGADGQAYIDDAGQRGVQDGGEYAGTHRRRDPGSQQAGPRPTSTG